MIIKITFADGLVMMFGDSYKDWEEQVEEYMRTFADQLKKPKLVETSKSKWISFGGLKWCAEENFQKNLNREGCQHEEPDNPNPRKYQEMTFVTASDKNIDIVINKWRAGQRMLKINKLNDEEYKLYQDGKLKIEID